MGIVAIGASIAIPIVFGLVLWAQAGFVLGIVACVLGVIAMIVNAAILAS
jgi:hypothetical protein